MRGRRERKGEREEEKERMGERVNADVGEKEVEISFLFQNEGDWISGNVRIACDAR